MTTNQEQTKTPAQLRLEEAQREVERERQELAERERQLREQQRLDESRRRREAWEQKAHAAVEALRVELTKAGLTAEWHGVDALDVVLERGQPGVRVFAEAETRRVSSFRRAETGQVTLVVSNRASYDERRRFPSKKDGTHSLEKILAVVQETLEGQLERARSEATAERRRKAAVALAASVHKSLSEADRRLVVGTYEVGHADGQGRWRSQTYVAPEGKVFVQVGTVTCTPDEALALVEALRFAREQPKKVTS